jgi:predicted amidohydrolase
VEADLIVLPERALYADSIEGLVEGDLEVVLTSVRDAVRKAGMATVVVGMPWIVDGGVRNSAFVIAQDRSVLTRYDQVSARPPFVPGVELKPMWFQIKVVWCVVTLGKDHLWDEIAELAALCGAQIVINTNNCIVDPYRRNIFWQAFSMFRPTSVFVNSVSNGRQRSGNGHSAIYDTPVDTRITYPVALERAAEAGSIIAGVYSQP